MSFFNSVFPDDCRLCERPLTNVSRIPVCDSCLELPQPLQADFFCTTCRTPFASAYALDENGVCVACAGTTLNFDAAYSYGSYDGALRKLIHLYKYAKIESLAQPLSRLLVQSLPAGEGFDVVIAMPMHWRKQWQRGFNQSALIAQPVARRYGLKVADNLRRTRYTKAQAGLSEVERRQNLKDSFYLRDPEKIRGKRVLLVDDVFTTGATLRAASEVLKAAGAARVSGLTLARVDHHVFRSRESVESEQRKRFDQSFVHLPVDGRKRQTAGTGVK